jgi:hypothetical protein
MGLPAIGAGWLLVHGQDLTSTTLEFAALVLALSLVAALPERTARATRPARAAS